MIYEYNIEFFCNNLYLNSINYLKISILNVWLNKNYNSYIMIIIKIKIIIIILNIK